ncbi:hypothetical protein BDV93DRAFT_472122 [Ceratobasidium sp. AG-I]|nr:hypothetical protein BDV93DRAFT_472122 [Ceratobasidium sp. AG-I]
MLCFTIFTLCFLSLVPALVDGKRGFAWPWYNENSALNASRLIDLNAQWLYNWETWRPTNAAGLDWIGMQRCMNCDSSPIAQLQDRVVSQNMTTLFTINEADLNAILPSDAAAWYIQYINPLNIRKALPSVTSSGLPGMGLDWVTQFFTACAGQCYVDYINLHWYGSLFTDFQAYVEQAHVLFPQYQIAITEFALQAPANQSQQADFLRQAMGFLDNAPYVSHYSVFLASSPSLFLTNDAAGAAYVGTGSTIFNDDGSLSLSGLIYVA